ncbi:hypothetical protein L1987_01720 [Smallanthus sonchifolius]|uniref:Uncharacterized protein n=1 Tax=Smallanthus sonchifolius TaxID=185202 RepID=A0ACB9K5R3_9ASTR|nr:hypothetical protein L1987_01720 [Smallanthus sonchifolius]
MVESQKFLAVQSRVYEGRESILFFAIFQSFMVLKGGLSDEYKKYILESELPNGTSIDEEVALFRVLDQKTCKQSNLNRSQKEEHPSQMEDGL